MTYAKLADGRIEYAPKTLAMNGQTIFNPTAEQYLSVGYLPVVTSEPPETDAEHYPESGWKQVGAEIRQVWEVKVLPPELPSDAERLDALESAVLALMGGMPNV